MTRHSDPKGLHRAPTFEAIEFPVLQNSLPVSALEIPCSDGYGNLMDVPNFCGQLGSLPPVTLPKSAEAQKLLSHPDLDLDQRGQTAKVPLRVADRSSNGVSLMQINARKLSRFMKIVLKVAKPSVQKPSVGRRLAVQGDLSRRTFLRGSALTTGASIVDAASVLLAQAQEDSGGMSVSKPDTTPITLQVNGTARVLQVEARATLAEVLRGPLGLTGTKVACNRGACSACTVLLDGLPVCSCMMLAIDVGARLVTTIEGLAQGDTLHPVQQAFIEHDALQCGFCTPGMVMSCAALLERTPAPNAEDVSAAISGHFCRCGTYPHVVAATLAAAKAGKG